MNGEVRPAEERDIPRILRLLVQVCNVHNEARPDLFRRNATKYTAGELSSMIAGRDRTPVFVFERGGSVLGYIFAKIVETRGDNVMEDGRELYVDDLCVDGEARGGGIGRRLYARAVELARGLGCRAVTLNVWEGNDGARRFYESLGMRPRKTCMETRL